MAGNIFDQFDAPTQAPPPAAAVGKGGNVFDQFDQPSPPVAPATAPPPQADAGQQLLQGHIDAKAARTQRAVPVVRNIKGDFIRKPIGEIEQHDFGPVIRTPDGKTFAFNETADVMLRDPTSGKLMAFERHPELDKPTKAESVGRELLEGFMVGPVTRLASSGAVPMAVQRGRALGFPVSAKAAQMGERMDDAAAFNTLGTEPFAPAFRSKGAARFSRTVEEVPVVGDIVRGPKAQTQNALADVQTGIAAQLGAAPTDEAAGVALQAGLDRFRTAGVSRIEPGVLSDLGIEARAPVQPSQTLSKGARAEAMRAEPIRQQLGGGIAETTRGVPVQSARPMSQTILARRTAEDLSDAELTALARQPAAATSFATRQEALYEQAHRKIPAMFRSDGSRNAGLVATPNAKLVAEGLAKAEQSARIQGGALEGRFGPLVRDLANAKSNFTLDALKSARTEIGRALASFGDYDARLDRTQLKSLYAAITRDYEAGLQTLANRAYVRTQLPAGAPDAVSLETAWAADRALRQMRVADRYTRLSMERMDKFTRLLNADSPEAAMRGLVTRIKEGTIDRGLVRAVTDALRPEEREKILGYLVANMGKQRPGTAEAEAGWNHMAFATDWNRNKAALGLMFHGTDPAIRKKLDALAQVAERMKYYETTKNFSGTAYAGIPFAGVASGAAGGLPGMVIATLGLAGGSAAVGKFLTNPKYLDWMVKAAAEGGQVQRAKGPQVGGTQVPAALANLEKIAANDNQLGDAIRKVVADLLNKDDQRPAVDPQLERQK